MGNSKSYLEKKVTIPASVGEWVTVGNTGYCELVKNTRTGVLAEQYHIPLDHRLPREEDEEIYQERRIQNDNLVTVYHIENENNQYMCQGKEFLTVRLERLPCRLSEMNNLSFTEILYILREAAVGYRAITDFYGPIVITDEMIGFTPDHRVKVWLNEEFAHNLPRQNANIFLRQPIHIEQRLPNTISQLFSVIQEHCESGQFPEHFAKAYRQYPLQTFSEALQFIEDYANKKGLNLRVSLASNSSVSAKTDHSLQEKHLPSRVSNPVLSTLVPAQNKQLIRISQEASETRKHYAIPESRTQKRLVISVETPKQPKGQLKLSNYFATLTPSNNSLHSARKISKTDHQLNFKIISPRDPKLTFNSVADSKIPKSSYKTGSSEISFPKKSISSTSASNPSVKNFLQENAQSHIKANQGTHAYKLIPSTTLIPLPTTLFKDPHNLGSPLRTLSKDNKMPQTIHERRVTDMEVKTGTRGRYQKLSSQTKSTMGGNLKVENAPRVITFNYPKPPKLVFKS